MRRGHGDGWISALCRSVHLDWPERHGTGPVWHTAREPDAPWPTARFVPRNEERTVRRCGKTRMIGSTARRQLRPRCEGRTISRNGMKELQRRRAPGLHERGPYDVNPIPRIDGNRGAVLR